MKRLIVLFYWIFKDKNNVTFAEIVKLTFFRASANKRALTYIESIELKGAFYEVRFKNNSYNLYWPIECLSDNINMIVCETFDKEDWHYYQKENTEVSSNEIILDVGAAEGLFSLTVVEKCKKIILVEPSRFFVTALQKTFYDYSDKVQIINVALGNQEGIISFSNDSVASRILEGEGGNQEQVRLTRVDNLQIEKVTYLKADIEGYEIEMLRGAEKTIRRDKPKIAITSYHVGNNSEEMIKLVLSYVPEYKYKIKGIGQWGGRPVMIHFWI